MSDDTPSGVDVLQPSYRPAMVIMLALVALFGGMSAILTALDSRIKSQVQAELALQAERISAVNQAQSSELETHEARIKALESTITNISINLAEIKSDLKYMRQQMEKHR